MGKHDTWTRAVRALARALRAVFYCQKCAGQATYAATCCGLPMQAG